MKMKINVYDFDKTIYAGDSTLDFYFYCLKKHPKGLFQLPKQCLAMVFYILGIYNKVQFKESFYIFLKALPNVEEDITNFWQVKNSRIKGWYMEKSHENDIIISASPEFLLEEVCRRLNVKLLIASKVDKRTGEYNGENCYGEEKVKRLNEIYKFFIIEEFYSDSLSDLPLSKLAKKSFIVKGNELIIWEQYKLGFIAKLKKIIFQMH